MSSDTSTMAPVEAGARFVGQSVRRAEDARLVAGRGRYVDDLVLPGMLHAAFVRSPHAHARIRGIDVSAALRREGVVAVYTAQDLGDYWKPGPLLVPPPPIKGAVFNERCQVPLAKDKVRHAGEPVALVIAESRYLAEDAAADVVVDYEPLPAVVDLERAAAREAPRVHDDVPGNVFLEQVEDGPARLRLLDLGLVPRRYPRHQVRERQDRRDEPRGRGPQAE